MKKFMLLVLVLVLLIGSVQVAFADPVSPNIPPNGGSCHMDNAGLEDNPGNAYGVEPGHRGMNHVHNNHPSPGADNMVDIYIAHGCLDG